METLRTVGATVVVLSDILMYVTRVVALGLVVVLADGVNAQR